MALYAQFVMGNYSRCFHLEGGINALGLHWGYTPQEVLSFFSARSTSQLECYGNFVRIWDNLFPMLYAIMHLLWLAYLFPARWLLLIPVLHMGLDWAENYIELQLLADFLATQNVSDAQTRWGSSLTLLKWGFSLLTYALILMGAVKSIWFYFRAKAR